MSGLCSIDGCTKPMIAKGLCTTHYARMRRNGTTETVYRSHEWHPCKIDGCDRRAKSQGMCNMHYARHLRGSQRVTEPAPVVGGTLMDRVRRLSEPGPGQCVIWTGPVTGTRQMPILRADGSNYSVRRLVWADAHDQQPETGKWVMPTCDTPRCVAPGHQEVVAPRDARTTPAMTSR